jgi:hypothetical protein
MVHTKIILFILILLAIVVPNGQTNPTGTIRSFTMMLCLVMNIVGVVMLRFL